LSERGNGKREREKQSEEFHVLISAKKEWGVKCGEAIIFQVDPPQGDRGKVSLA
jgi:hypothetical protein